MFEAISSKLQAVFKKLRSQGKLTERNIKDGLHEVRLALLEGDVHYKVARELIERVQEQAIGEKVLGSVTPGQQVVKLVYEELVRVMGPARADLARAPSPPTVLFVVGLQGSGKTTVAGKLARRLKGEGRRVLLVAADTERPAAPRQLEMLAEQVGVTVSMPREGMKPLDVVLEALSLASREGYDTVLVDTQGRLHIDGAMMDELAEMKRRVKPAEILLVADAMTGQDAVRIAQEFEGRLGIDGIILTKLDGDARGGAALSLRAVSGKPIKFAGVGEKLDALEPFIPERMASRILGMGDIVTLVEKAQAELTQKEAEDLERKVRRETLTLEDFLRELGRLRRMGPLGDLVKLIPGMGSLPAEGFEEGDVRRTEAIILSMTREERLNPDIIDGSRRRRIASGSGTSVQDINQLLKQFATVKRMLGVVAKKGWRPGPARGWHVRG